MMSYLSRRINMEEQFVFSISLQKEAFFWSSVMTMYLSPHKQQTSQLAMVSCSMNHHMNITYNHQTAQLYIPDFPGDLGFFIFLQLYFQSSFDPCLSIDLPVNPVCCPTPSLNYDDAFYIISNKEALLRYPTVLRSCLFQSASTI